MWQRSGLVLAMLTLSTSAWSKVTYSRSKSSPGAAVYFIAPKDGATVSSPVKVIFGLSGMGIAPAGVKRAGTGHHHLLINHKLAQTDRPMPGSDTLKHFGGGQTEATIELPPGKHKLQLVLGDHLHIPHKPVVRSKVITIRVKK